MRVEGVRTEARRVLLDVPQPFNAALDGGHPLGSRVTAYPEFSVGSFRDIGYSDVVLDPSGVAVVLGLVSFEQIAVKPFSVDPYMESVWVAHVAAWAAFDCYFLSVYGECSLSCAHECSLSLAVSSALASSINFSASFMRSRIS